MEARQDWEDVFAHEPDRIAGAVLMGPRRDGPVPCVAYSQRVRPGLEAREG
jgi:hypothetical protein